MIEKIELLAPAGDLNSAKAAIIAGADAIYMGLNKFNARNRATNIDFDDLYTENSSVIDGAAYLWSHASPPLRDNDGNEVMNFNTNDYAIITVGSGNTAGGDGIIPNAENTIGSGQGFFIKGDYEFKYFSLHKFEEKKLEKGERLFENKGAASQDKPFYFAGESIEVDKKQTDNGYYFKLKSPLAPGSYVGWLGTSFWIVEVQ